VFGLIGFSLLSQEIWGFELVEPPQPISPAVFDSITSWAATIRRRPDVGRGLLEASVSDRDRQLRRRASIYFTFFCIQSSRSLAISRLFFSIITM
jgi:hypothetical protein